MWLSRSVSLEKKQKGKNYASVIKPFRIDLSKKEEYLSPWSRFFFGETFYLKWIWCVFGTICLNGAINRLIKCAANIWMEPKTICKSWPQRRERKKRIIPISRACSREIMLYLKTHHVGRKKRRKKENDTSSGRSCYKKPANQGKYCR